MSLNSFFESLPLVNTEESLPQEFGHGHQFYYEFYLRNPISLQEHWTFTRYFRTHCEISSTLFKVEIRLRRYEDANVVAGRLTLTRCDEYQDVIVRAFPKITFKTPGVDAREFKTPLGAADTMLSGKFRYVFINSIMPLDIEKRQPIVVYVTVNVTVEYCHIVESVNGYGANRLTTNHFLATPPVVESQLHTEGYQLCIKFSLSHMETLIQDWILVRDVYTHDATSATKWRFEMRMEPSNDEKCGHVRFERSVRGVFGIYVRFTLKFSKGKHSYMFSKIKWLEKDDDDEELRETLSTQPYPSFCLMEGNLQVEADIRIARNYTSFLALPWEEHERRIRYDNI